MDIRQLKAFIAVFEERSITAAAQRLCITQPTLSVTIRQLEEDLATTLFERLARGVAVTEDARLFYPQARQLVDQAAGLLRLFRQRHHCQPLSLGIEADLGVVQVSTLLNAARAAIPGLLLSVVDGCAGDARLAAEELRCEDELFLPLWEETFVLALPRAHPLASRSELAMAELHQLDWITCPQHASHQRLLAMHGEGSAGLMLAAHAGSLQLALRMVEAGYGVALLPPSLLEGNSSVVGRPLSGPGLSRRLGLCYAAQALEKPALRALHDYLQAGGQMAPSPPEG